jgi:hypothetical protein
VIQRATCRQTSVNFGPVVGRIPTLWDVFGTTGGGAASYLRMTKELIHFTAEDREAFKKAKAIAQGKQNDVQQWGQALADIEKHEWWRIDGEASMQEWCSTWVPLTQRLLRTMMERYQRIMNETVITGTTGEVIIKNPKKKKVKDKRVRDNTHPATNNNNSSPTPESHTPRAAPKEKIYDQVGHEVPAHLEASYRARPEFSELTNRLKGVKEQLELLRKGDRIWKKVTTIAESHIEGAIAEIAGAMPHTVCTECQGFYEETKKGNCISCNSTGLMNEDQFRKVDKTVQQIHRTNHESTNLSRLSNSLS